MKLCFTIGLTQQQEWQVGHCAEMGRVYKPVSLTCVRDDIRRGGTAPKDTPGIALQ